MKQSRRLFSQYRLKQLSNYLVLVLSVNILLENISQNLVQASSTLSTRLAVLNSINNYLMPVAPTMPVFPPVFVGQLSAITTNLTTAMVASAPNPNLFTPALLNNNNGTCSSGVGDCKCLTDGYCAAEYGPLAITNFFALNHRMIAPWIVTDYYKLAFNLLYAGANVNYVLNQPTTAGNFVPPISVPDTPTTLNLLANFFTPDTTTYPGLKLDLDQNGAGSGILIKTPVGTPAGQVSPFCQALVSVNPLNFANPNPNNIWLGGICTNSAAVQALGSHCCGTNLCNTTSGANLGQDTGGNPYGYCDQSCSNLGQGCMSDSSCCTSTGPAACDLKTKVCVSCVIAGDGCLEDSDCCQAQNLKCDQTSFQCVSCVPAGDKALVSTDCCSGTTFDSTSQVCQSSCKTVNTACPNGNSDCCASQGLLCSDPTVGNADGVCLVAPGSTCDPTAEYSPCQFGYVCDATEKKCLPGGGINTVHCCLIGSTTCTPQLDPPCANGLTCDPSPLPRKGHTCCAVLNGTCYTSDDCCANYLCDKPASALDSTPGVCKLWNGESCGQYGAAGDQDCVTPLVCGTVGGTSPGETPTQVCCGQANSTPLATCSNGDINCCNGSICDMTATTCVTCIPNGNSCAYPHGATNCCSGSCYAEKCVEACTSCITQGEPCMAAPGSSSATSYASCCNGCGGDALTCDAVTQQCQTCGGPGSVCVTPGDTDPANMCCARSNPDEITCGYSATAPDTEGSPTCCVNLTFACAQDADCCISTIGQVYCNPSSNLCDVKCIISEVSGGTNVPGLCEGSAPTTPINAQSLPCCVVSDSSIQPTCTQVDVGGSFVCAIALAGPGDVCIGTPDCLYGECDKGKCCSHDGDKCTGDGTCCGWGTGSVCDSGTCTNFTDDDTIWWGLDTSIAGVIGLCMLFSWLGSKIVVGRMEANIDLMGAAWGLDPDDIAAIKASLEYGMFSKGANKIEALRNARIAYAEAIAAALLKKLNTATGQPQAEDLAQTKREMLKIFGITSDDDLATRMTDIVQLAIQAQAGELDGNLGDLDPLFLTIKGRMYSLGKGLAAFSKVAKALDKVQRYTGSKEGMKHTFSETVKALASAATAEKANGGQNSDKAELLANLSKWFSKAAEVLPDGDAKTRFTDSAATTMTAATAAGYKPKVQPALNPADVAIMQALIATNAAKAIADQAMLVLMPSGGSGPVDFSAVFNADPVDFAKLYFEVMAVRVAAGNLVDDLDMAKALAMACGMADTVVVTMGSDGNAKAFAQLFSDNAETLGSGERARPISENLATYVANFKNGMPLSVQKAIFLAAGQTFTSIADLGDGVDASITGAIENSYEYLKDIPINGVKDGAIYTYKVSSVNYSDPVIFRFPVEALALAAPVGTPEITIVSVVSKSTNPGPIVKPKVLSLTASTKPVATKN
jgi:hypothetical protein